MEMIGDGDEIEAGNLGASGVLDQSLRPMLLGHELVAELHHLEPSFRLRPNAPAARRIPRTPVQLNVLCGWLPHCKGYVVQDSARAPTRTGHLPTTSRSSAPWRTKLGSSRFWRWHDQPRQPFHRCCW